MSEVSTSRRAVMRALAILPAAIVTPPAAHAAVELICSPAANAGWGDLLARERRAAAAYDALADLEEAAYDRFYDARSAAVAQWQAEWDDKAGKPWKFIDARPVHEAKDTRVDAGVQDHNAFCERMRNERDALEAPLLQRSGLPEAEAQCSEARKAHVAAIQAVIAFPSRDPDIIAHKLRMLVDLYGDDNGDLTPLLTSISGEQA